MATTHRTRVRTEQAHKRVRAYLGGKLVADTVKPVLVWEIPYYPAYYIPLSDVRAELVEDGPGEHSPSRGDSTAYTVRVDGVEAKGAALRYKESQVEELRDLVRLDWDTMTWFEEDEEIRVHPRDPYHRIDVLASSRHVRVEVDGVTVAESSTPRLLFETGLPVRYYLPKTHVRMDLLEPTDTVTGCPYKGQAEYWAVRVNGETHPDIVWSYATPLPESQKIAGLVCFYDEKVDVFVDGVKQERPKTPFA